MLDLCFYALALAAGIYFMWRGQELCSFHGKHIEAIKSVTRGPEAAREFAQKQGFVVRGMGFFMALYSLLSFFWGGLWGELFGMLCLGVALFHFFFIFTINSRYTGDSKTKW